jgi:hypothetical protein
MKRLFLTAMAAGAGIILASTAGVRGAILYQDTASQVPGGQVMNIPTATTVGEQIWLGTGTTPMYLTNFSFEYYSPYNPYSGNVQMDVQLFANTGPTTNGYHSPAAVPFFDSGFFTLINPWYAGSPSTNSATLTFNLASLLSGNTINIIPFVALPSNFTFAVTVTGLQGADSVGLPIFTSPQVGYNAGDYWYDVSGNWELLTNSIGPVQFGAQFLGTAPEPSVLCLGALGAATLTFMARRRQRRE